MRKNYVYLLIALFFVFSACQEDAVEENSTIEEEVQGWNVRFNQEGNYLEFETYEKFQETISMLKEMNSKQADAWSKQYGFASLKAVYDQAITEQRRYIENLEKKVEAGKLAVEDVTQRRAPFVEKHASSFIFDDEIEGDFDMNIFNPDIAKVVNKTGIVKIGNALSQYTNQTIKIMEGGSSNQIDLLISSKSNNLDLGIKVNPVKLFQSTTLSDNQRANTDKEVRWTLPCSNTASGSPFCRGTRIRGNVTIYGYEDASGKSRMTGVASTKHYFSGLFGWNLNIGGNGYVVARGRAEFIKTCDVGLPPCPERREYEIPFSIKSDENDPSISHTFYDGPGDMIGKHGFQHLAESGTPPECNIPLSCTTDLFNRGISKIIRYIEDGIW